jgi:ParB-like chromosome segregation protein Spo0J
MEPDVIKELGNWLDKNLAGLRGAELMGAINLIRMEVSKHSPLRAEPVDCVLWVPSALVQANDYNPNTVAAPEMELLRESIMADGYTQPVVVMQDGDVFPVVDGFHRTRVGKEVKAVSRRVMDLIPVACIRHDRSDKADRMAATIRHNRARGKHGVDAMSAIVMDLAKRNWSDAKIGRELGMEPDEVLRLKQITGLAELFQDRVFSEAWEPG